MKNSRAIRFTHGRRPNRSSGPQANRSSDPSPNSCSDQGSISHSIRRPSLLRTTLGVGLALALSASTISTSMAVETPASKAGQASSSIAARQAASGKSMSPGALAPAGLPRPAATQAGREELVSTPIPDEPNIPSYGTTTDKGGRPLAFVVSGGYGGSLNVIDLKNKRKIDVKKTVLDKDGAELYPWGYATLSNRHVVAACSNGRLYDIDPDTYAVKRLGDDGSSNKNYEEISKRGSFYWDIVADEHDRLYIASSSEGHGGRVLTYDAKNGRWGDLTNSQIQEGERDIRSVAYENGVVYAGTGMTKPSIYRIPTANPRAQRLNVPAALRKGSGSVASLEAKGGRLYVTMSDMRNADGSLICDGACALDPNTGALLGKARSFTKRVVARPGEAKKVYYFATAKNPRTGASERNLMEHNPDDGSERPVFTNDEFADNLSRSAWVTHDVFVSTNINRDGITVYDAKAKTGATFKAKLNIAPRSIQSMIAPSDGKLYAGWFMHTRKIARIDPASRSYSLLPQSLKQVESFAQSGDWLVSGLYTGGMLESRNLKTGETRKPIEVAKGKNQDRPFAMTSVENGRVAVGTVPGYGKLGGALGFYDVAKNQMEPNRVYLLKDLPVADPALRGSLDGLSPISMAYRNGKLYVGTTARGGSGSAFEHSAKSEGKVFVFDVAKQTVTAVKTPVPGFQQYAVTALTFGDDGKLYGTTGGYVFELNPNTLDVVKRAKVSGGKEVNRSQLVYKSGMLYGVFQPGTALFPISAQTFKASAPVARGVSGLVRGTDGNLYYAKGPSIYRYTPN